MNLEELNTNLEKVNFSLIQKENELKDQQINIFILNKNITKIINEIEILKKQKIELEDKINGKTA